MLQLWAYPRPWLWPVWRVPWSSWCLLLRGVLYYLEALILNKCWQLVKKTKKDYQVGKYFHNQQYIKKTHCLCCLKRTGNFYFSLICLIVFLPSLPQDVFYHFIAVLFYFAAFVLEAAATAANGGTTFSRLQNGTESVLCVTNPRGNIFTALTYRQYSINVAATVSPVNLFTCLHTAQAGKHFNSSCPIMQCYQPDCFCWGGRL